MLFKTFKFDSNLSPSFFILVSRNLVPVAPFAFHFGMFNISFPYRSCKHVRQGRHGLGREKVGGRGSRKARRNGVEPLRGWRCARKLDERTRKRRKTVQLVDNQPGPIPHPLRPPPLLSLLLPSRFLHSKQLTTPEKEAGVTLPACLLSYRFCPSFGRRSRPLFFRETPRRDRKVAGRFQNFPIFYLSLFLPPFTYCSVPSFCTCDTISLSLSLSGNKILLPVPGRSFRFRGNDQTILAGENNHPFR